MQVDGRETFSTAQLPVHQRLGRWIEFGSQTLSEMRVTPVDRDTFQASLSRVEVGGLGFCWMSTTPAVARSVSNDIGSWAAPMKDSVLLIVQHLGRSWIDHSGWQGELRPGDMVFRNPTSAWRNRALEPASIVFVKIPLVRLLATVGDFDILRGTPIRSNNGRACLAASVILSVRDALAAEPMDVRPNEVAELVLESVKLTCRGMDVLANAPDGLGERRRLRRAICYFVERNLGDPNLSATRIASDLGLNVRRIQRLFAELGQTPSGYILTRRLDRAAQMLRQMGQSKPRNVTEVAYSVGFNELSYFCRAFSRRFRQTPGAYWRSCNS